MAKTFELKTTLSADSNNSSLFVDDTAGYLGSPSEVANLPSAVVGLELTAFGGNVPLAGARLEGGGGTVTVSDTPNPQSVADVAGNGNYSAGWSTLADGAVTSSLLVGDPASQSTGANGNVAPPDTDNSLTPTLSVNAQNPADVVFTVSGLGSGYSGTVTFTDSANKSDVVAIKGNGTYSANLSNLADGSLTYLLKASDPAGNVITVDPTTTLGLPPGVTLQPINGGPDYYANNGFTYAANAGWDNPSFFAIGPFEEAVTSEADVTLWHGLNWNTAFNIQGNFDLALAGASTGIWVIQNISDGLLPGTGAETVGLLTYDEPSTFAEGVTTPLSTTANSIQDGRFWYINNTWNFIAYGGLSPVNSSAQVLDTLVTTPNGTQVHIDASSIDAYWFSGANISSIQGELGLLDNLPGNATAAEVARGSNYGDIITDEEAITGGSQPIFGFVETGGPYTEDTSASDYITPAELNWAVWSQLIHGANGIDYFDHSFAGPAVSDSNVQDAYYQTVHPGQTVSIYTQIQQTDALVTQLAPVLNSPTALGYVTVNNAAYENGTILSPFSGIEVMAKDDNGQFYIFADTADALTQTNIAATFTIADTNATSVTVVGENRTIPVVDGVFSDTFATAATVHIYEVNDGGSSSPPPPPDPPAAPVISSGVANSNESVTLKGTAPDGSTVTVSDGSATALGTATASSTGAWSFTTADLAAGSYAFTATDTTSAGTSGASSPFDVTVTSSSPPPSGSNLVANGNFATDSFSGWTLGGNYTSTYFGPEIFIDTDAEGSSAYAAGMGSVGSDGTLSQTIATTAGQTYTLSFWLQNEASGTNDFKAIWNGQTLLSLSNAAQSGYTEYTYTVTATGSTTTLEFSAANGPSQWDLDNVSLTANSTPPADPKVIQTDTSSFGSTSLTEVGNQYYLYNSSGVGPALKYKGADVVAGQTDWSPIGAVQTASGYEVAWELTGAEEYTVWNADSNGNYVSSAIGVVSGTSSLAIGVIGPPETVIATDGSTSLTEVGNLFYLYNSSGSGPDLKYEGADVVASQTDWSPIGAVQTGSGYEVAWKLTGADEYTVWNADSNGNYVSNAIGVVSGTSTALESFESIFQQDLNGDGVIGLYAAPGTTLQISAPLADPSGSANIGTGARLELAAADSGSVTFSSSTGTLILESPSTFSGEIFNFTGNGSLSGSDQIDLTNINFNSVKDSYANGVLTVTDGTNTDKLDFSGSYTLANFDFASDGSGGTIVYDPPASEPPIGGSATIGTGATLELGAACSEAVTFSGSTGTLVLGNSSTSGGQSSNSTGTVSGFGAQDVIDLPGIAFDAQTTLGYSPNSNQTGGILSLTDGAQSAKIALLGNYMASSFAVASDNHGGTMVTEASATNQSLLTNPQHT